MSVDTVLRYAMAAGIVILGVGGVVVGWLFWWDLPFGVAVVVVLAVLVCGVAQVLKRR